MGVPQNGWSGKSIYKWMIWDPYFRKPPNEFTNSLHSLAISTLLKTYWLNIDILKSAQTHNKSGCFSILSWWINQLPTTPLSLDPFRLVFPFMFLGSLVRYFCREPLSEFGAHQPVGLSPFRSGAPPFSTPELHEISFEDVLVCRFSLSQSQLPRRSVQVWSYSVWKTDIRCTYGDS